MVIMLYLVIILALHFKEFESKKPHGKFKYISMDLTHPIENNTRIIDPVGTLG